MAEEGGKYDHRALEQKWQERWAKEKTFETPDVKKGSENFYFLTEFPYPSGNLHVGHWYAFSVPDIFARYMRMRGYNVLYPIGFDAFGLPAENAAIKRGINPRNWTFDNIDYMRGQLRSMGASFDWSREVITASPEYYQWTQWLFLQFYKKGLVYRKETAVNWCPVDKTVLANEQVVDGHCERCGAQVVQKMMAQWNIKITDYADRLIDDLEGLDWPKQIKDAQINWIGRSEGAVIDFPLSDGKGNVTVFTTRPDTLFGATYVVLAPEHPLVAQFADAKVKEYVDSAAKKTELERTSGQDKEKTGVELKGVKAINPATKEEVPIYVADYVLGHYGTGAIMAVPAHDERDFEFAKKFNLPIRQVVMPSLVDTSNPPQEGKEHTFRNMILAIVHDPKTNRYLTLRWKDQPWTSFVTGGVEEGEDRAEAARREIVEETGYSNIKLVRSLGMNEAFFFAAHKNVNRKVHGEHFLFELVDNTQTPVAESEKSLHEVAWLTPEELEKTKIQHVEFPMLWERIRTGVDAYTGPGILFNSGKFDGMGSEEAKKKITEFVGGTMTKQYHLRDWVVSRQRYWGVPIPMIHCKKCGYHPVKEADLPVVLPEIEDYLPRDDGKSPLAKASQWVAVECPNCGGAAERETDTLDTFVDSSWYFQRYTDPHNTQEFASKETLESWLPVDLYSGGSEHTTMHVLYSRFWHKAMYDLGLVAQPEPYLRRMNRGLIMGPDGQKMSKSRGNVIDPDEVVRELGADTVRMYLAFIGPYNEVGAYPWNPRGALGVRRFLERAMRLKIEGAMTPELSVLLNQTIKKVGEDIASLKMNTGVSALMILLNELEGACPKEAYEAFVRLLTPFAPHVAHELAERHGVDLSVWPTFDESQLLAQKVTVAVQVNGKTRATVELGPDAAENEALEAAKEAAQKWITGPVRQVVYRPGKIISLVV